MAKLPKSVKPHLHPDLSVTEERVDAFAIDTRTNQLLVLAELRRRAHDKTTSTELSLFALVLALVALVFEPATGLELSELPLGVGIVVGVVAGFLLVLPLVPFLIPQLVRDHQQSRAQVWLAAFESELGRRQLQPGRAGREWRRSH